MLCVLVTSFVSNSNEQWHSASEPACCDFATRRTRRSRGLADSVATERDHIVFCVRTSYQCVVFQYSIVIHILISEISLFAVRAARSVPAHGDMA